MEVLGIFNAADFFSKVFGVLVAIVLMVISLFSSRTWVNYYIDKDPDVSAEEHDAFSREVVAILAKSGWNEKYYFRRVWARSGALFTIKLTPRIEMDKVTVTRDFYPDGSRIYFSATVQSRFNRPQIFIDQVNWQEGVKWSGLSRVDYRTYLINHEVGHALGYDHVSCNTAVCPVMYQSTRGCPADSLCGKDVTEVDYSKRLEGRFFYF